MTYYSLGNRLEDMGLGVDYVDTEHDAITGRLTYIDYNVTVTRGGKTYNVARLTTYPDESALVFADVNKDRLQTTRKAWATILNVLGYSTNREERYAARAMAADVVSSLKNPPRIGF